MDLEVVESLKESGRCTASAPILVPSPDAEFAVVSDLDDTVIKSSATTTLRQLEILFTHDARSRAAFAGVEPLYHALVAGPDGRGVNPIFYVSRAGWNLYDLFRRFLEDKDIPRGPMFLQDLAIGDSKSSAIGRESHKRDRIRISRSSSSGTAARRTRRPTADSPTRSRGGCGRSTSGTCPRTAGTGRSRRSRRSSASGGCRP
ncbi:MAG: DUF2183 domain-containing protein, partial [Gemmatimonadota bacterium]